MSFATALEARSLVSTGIRYSICTLVTRPDQYEGMLSSFGAQGFNGEDCEFIKVDNVGQNQCDAYQGVNLFLSVARGDYIIICHQDVLLIDDRSALDRALGQLDSLDPSWAVCGNSGAMSPIRLAIRISDPHGEDVRTGALPAKVQSLDENFIVVRRSANLAVSYDLSGFHMYGTDLCVIADILGRSAYVVDFHVRHLSPGTRDRSLETARWRFTAKYNRAFRPRWLRSTCELVYLSGASLLSRVLSTSWSMRLVNRLGLGH